MNDREKAKALGNGFQDHGVAVPVSSTRGVVAVADEAGRDLVLTWLADSTGCAGLLAIDAETGGSTLYPMPFAAEGGSQFALLYSSRNRIYTHFKNRLVEFDLRTRTYTCIRETKTLLGIGMTEDDRGRIWGAGYPDGGVFMHDPETGEFHDYGPVYHQPWRIYPYTLATDNADWVYFSVGKTLSQFVALNIETGKATPLLRETERIPGVTSHIYRDEDGNVYGLSDEKHWSDGRWYELRDGKAVELSGQPPNRPKPMIGGSIWPFHCEFPSGRRIKSLDMTGRKLVVEDSVAGTEKTLTFDYPSEGTHLMAVAAIPGGRIGGGGAFPMRFFEFDPATGQFEHNDVFGQTNVLTAQSDRVFMGMYTEGILEEWDPARPWVAPRKDAPNGNPRILANCEPDINRPHAMLAHSDGRTIVMGGTPGYGHTGGGLLFWDRKTETSTLLKHVELLRDHCVMSLVELPNGKLLIGSGTRAGTGGEVRAKEAELIILDIATKKVEWHAALIPGAQEYSEMHRGSDGLIYGIADFRVYEPTLMDEEKLFFVFDPVSRRILYQEQTAPVFGSIHLQQGQRKIIVSPEGQVYLLFRKGIAQADPQTFKLAWIAQSPVSINTGGAWSNGRIWFSSGSRLYSYTV